MKSKTLMFKGATIHYMTNGKPDHEAIVMLHPAFGDHHVFEGQVDKLGDYYMIMIDMVAHGQTNANKTDVTMGDMPDIIKTVLDAEHKSKAHVMGVSLGSIVAQAFGHFYPEHTLSMTVVGGYSIHRNNDHILKAQRKEMGKWLLYILFSMKKFRAYVSDVSAYTQHGKEVMRQGAEHINRGTFMKMQGTDKFFVEKEGSPDYKILVVCGEHDLPLAMQASKEFVEFEPLARLYIAKDAGHCANLDKPEAFNEEYKIFLKNA